MKISLSGVSGVGKTTLAKQIAEHYGIPFISGSAKVLWKKHDIIDHADLIERTIGDIAWGYEFQLELLELRRKTLIENESFVTDRAPIDSLAYFLSQLAPFLSEKQTKVYIDNCIDLMDKYNHKIFMSYIKPFEVVEDGARITNRYYQVMMQSIFNDVIYKQNYLDLCKGCVIEIPNLTAYDQRLPLAIHSINEKINSNSSIRPTP